MSEKAQTKQLIQLTPELLNREIIKLRAPIQQAKAFLGQKSVRKRKYLTARNEKRSTPKAENVIARLGQDIKALKELDRDEVAKFALLNTEDKQKLLTKAKTPEERALYLVISEKPVLKIIQEFRSTYYDWKVSTPFILQRLGLQYSGNRAAMTMLNGSEGSPKKKSSNQNEENENSSSDDNDNDKEVENQATSDSDDEAEEDNDDSVKGADETEEEEIANENESTDDAEVEEENEETVDEDEDDEEISDVEMGSDSDDDTELVEERRRLLLGLAGISEDKSRPKPAPKKRKLVNSDDEDDGPEEEEEETKKTSEPVAKSSKKAVKDVKSSDKDVKSTEKEVKKPTKDQKAAKPTVSNKKNKVTEEASSSKNSTTAKPSVVSTILTQTLQAKHITLKQMRKSEKKSKGVPKIMDNSSLNRLVDFSKLQSTTGGVIQQIKLSDGGEVKFSKSSTTAPKEEDKEEESEDTKKPKRRDFFFASNGDDSGEESVDDDEDMPVADFQKGEKGSFRKDVGSKRAYNQKIERAGYQAQRPKFDKFDKFAKKTKAPRQESKFSKKTDKGPAGMPDELHPSWAARRQAKEQANAVPQGKRTIFSDE